MNRRKFLGVAGCCAVGLAAVDTFVVEPSWLEVVERDVPIPGLPKNWQGYRIAHLSDVHLHRLGGLHDSVFEAIRRIDPHLIVLSGDTIEAPDALRVLEDFCGSLTSNNGREVMAVVGNWEHWGHVDMSDLDKAYTRCGVRLIRNASILSKSGMAVMATDDYCSGHDDLVATLRNVPASPVRLFLTHAPGIFDRIPNGAPTFDLGLAGHTHGGQVRALGAAVWVPPGSGRFTAGMYETSQGRIYVSRGIGTSVISARFTCRPELPVFRLIAA